VPIGTDGEATVFNLSTSPAGSPVGSDQSLVIQYGQVIPRPFCASGAEFLRVEGAVNLRKSVQVAEGGSLASEFNASGRLRLTPVDPSTGTPIAPSYEAEVMDHQVTHFDDRGGWIEGLQVQTELPRSVSGHGQRMIRIRLGSQGTDQYKKDIDCTP
jgi:hypothetical protein